MESSSGKTADKGSRRNHNKEKEKAPQSSSNENLSRIRKKRHLKQAVESKSIKRRKESIVVDKDDFIEFIYPTTNETEKFVQTAAKSTFKKPDSILENSNIGSKGGNGKPNLQNKTFSSTIDSTKSDEEDETRNEKNENMKKSLSAKDAYVNQIYMSNDQCAVCGDILYRKCLGVRSCIGCRLFFRNRTLRKQHGVNDVCMASKNCVIDKVHRNDCKHCRYQKCISAGMNPERITKPTYTNIHKMKKPKFNNNICAVCGQISSRSCYGVQSCQGCVGFFERTVRLRKEYICMDSKNCLIDKMHRNACQYCRYQKCLFVGMNPELVDDLNLLKDVKVDQIHENDHKCAVCGDMADHISYGALSCVPCAVFFKITTSRGINDACKNNKNCPINKLERKKCRPCRFQKCISAGMIYEPVNKRTSNGNTGTCETSLNKKASALQHDHKNGEKKKNVKSLRTRAKPYRDAYSSSSTSESEENESEFYHGDHATTRTDSDESDEEDEMSNGESDNKRNTLSVELSDSEENENFEDDYETEIVASAGRSDSTENTGTSKTTLKETASPAHFDRKNGKKKKNTKRLRTRAKPYRDSSSSSSTSESEENESEFYNGDHATTRTDSGESDEEDEMSNGESDNKRNTLSVELSDSEENEKFEDDYETEIVASAGRSDSTENTGTSKTTLKETASPAHFDRENDEKKKNTKRVKTRVKPHIDVSISSSTSESEENESEFCHGDNATTRHRLTYSAQSVAKRTQGKLKLHKPNKLYKCEYEGCDKEYENYDLFKRHIGDDHKDNVADTRKSRFFTKQHHCLTSIQTYLSLREDIGIELPELEPENIDGNEEIVQIINKIYVNNSIKPIKTYFGCFIVCIKPQFYVKDKSLLEIINENKDDPDWEVGIFVDSACNRGPCRYHTHPCLSIHSNVTKLALNGWKIYAMDVPFNESPFHHENKEDALFFQLRWKFTSIIRKYLKPSSTRDKIKFLNKSVQTKGCTRRLSEADMLLAIKNAYAKEMPSDIMQSDSDKWYEYDLMGLLEYNKLHHGNMKYHEIEDIEDAEFEDQSSEEHKTHTMRNWFKKEVRESVLEETHTLINNYDPQPHTFSILFSRMITYLAIINSPNQTILTSELIKFVWTTFPNFREDLRLDIELIKPRILQWIRCDWFETVDWDVQPFSIDKVHSLNKEKMENILSEFSEWKYRHATEIKSEMAFPDDFHTLMDGTLGIKDYTDEDLLNVPDLSWYTENKIIPSNRKVAESKVTPPIMLIALAIINSKEQALTRQEIVNFIWTTFPNFGSSWKDDYMNVQQRMNKWAENARIKYDRMAVGGSTKKANNSKWTLTETFKKKTLYELTQWKNTYESDIRKEMSNPDDLDELIKGTCGIPEYTKEQLENVPVCQLHGLSEEKINAVIEKSKYRNSLAKSRKEIRQRRSQETVNDDCIKPRWLVALAIINSPTQSITLTDLIKFVWANFTFIKDKYTVDMDTVWLHIFGWTRNTRFEVHEDKTIKAEPNGNKKYSKKYVKFDEAAKTATINDVNKWKIENEAQIKAALYHSDDFEKLFQGTLGIEGYTEGQIANLPDFVKLQKRKTLKKQKTAKKQ